MNNRLIELYQSIIEDVEAVYVFPDIEKTSKYNPYLKIFYKEFLSQSEKENNIRCISPHPLIPIFILKKIFGEKSIVHYHWLEFSDLQSLLVLLWKMGLLLLYKFTGGNIVLSVHNKHPHKKKFLSINNFFRRSIAKITSKIHVHCKEAVNIISPILNLPPNKFFIIEHPMYPTELIGQGEARDHIEKTMLTGIDISKPLFLMYGIIGEYKGIIDIIPLIKENIGQLIIAGECKKGERNYLHRVKKAIEEKKNIHLINKLLTKEEEMYLFNAVDCILFNSKDILSSGSVMLALSYMKKNVIPNIGCLKELSGPYIFKFNSQTELKDRIHDIAADISH